MVHSVVAVTKTDKLRRDAQKTRESYQESGQSPSLFSQILEQKEQELEKAPMNCRTITYGSDSKLHTFQYQSKEYHY